MRQLLKRMLITAALIVGLVTPMLAVPVGAADEYKPCSDPVNAETTLCKNNASDPGIGSVIRSLINVLLFVTGIIAVVVIIVGGILYATSNGDQNAVGKAKNAILYAVIGLVVALLGLAIVNWVVDWVT